MALAWQRALLVSAQSFEHPMLHTSLYRVRAGKSSRNESATHPGPDLPDGLRGVQALSLLFWGELLPLEVEAPVKP